MKGTSAPLTLRPYQLLCIICSRGEEGRAPTNEKLAGIIEAIERNPDLPITLACNAGDVYVYQDPGTQEGAKRAGAASHPEGADFNRKRDLDILQKLDLPPGCILPARILFRHLLNMIKTVVGICGYESATSADWVGCPKAKSGSYENGHRKGITGLIPPRSEQELAREKGASLRALYETKAVRIRPHILLCAVCQYGSGVRPPFKPDNLPELVEMVLTKKPDIPVTLVRGADWMMCAPCAARVPELNACVCGPIGSGGLYNELKDLNVLQRAGLTYGTTMKARSLFKLLLEKIPTIVGICALRNDGKAPNSFWWDPCGEKKPPTNYEKGREALLEELR